MKKQKGFSLVEVLVASMIIMLGVTGYVSLQSEYVIADAKRNLRGVALELAQRKLDDLVHFGQLQSIGELHAYIDITSNYGGVMHAGNHQIQLSTNPLNTHDFHIAWQVEDLFYVDTNNDKKRDSWVKRGMPNFLNPSSKISDLKVVNVEVSWLDIKGNAKKLIVSSNIAPIPLSNSVHAKYKALGAFIPH